MGSRHGTTSGHRWYLLMVLEARAFLSLCERLSIRPLCQEVLVSIPGIYGVGSFQSWGDLCSSDVMPVSVRYVLMWGLGTNAEGCSIWARWVHWYVMFYVVCFHYLRPLVSLVTKVVPKGPAWAAAATGTSMALGTLMALYHYPNTILETGADASWALLELAVSALQPSLFALGTSYWSVNAAWWGNSTLGCYLIHFCFRDRFTEAFERLGQSCSWDQTGLLFPILVVLLCFTFTSTIGPLGHYCIIAPQRFFAEFAKRRHQSRREHLHD